MTAMSLRAVAIDPERLAQWLVALDAVIDELHADLVRRSIVHLTTLRQDLLEASSGVPQGSPGQQ